MVPESGSPDGKRQRANEQLTPRSFNDLNAAGGPLPGDYRPHKLSGEWKGVWECHIEPDRLLIYDITLVEVLLIRTGSHSDLFE
jgi:mRNA interferase YafQ